MQRCYTNSEHCNIDAVWGLKSARGGGGGGVLLNKARRSVLALGTFR